MKSSMVRLTLLGSVGILVVNVLLVARSGSQFGLLQQQQPPAPHVRIGSDFFSSFTPVEETVSHHALLKKTPAAVTAGEAVSSSTTTTTTTTIKTSRLTTAASLLGGPDGQAEEDIVPAVAAAAGRNLQQRTGADGTTPSGDLPPLRYPKMLMGIFSSDSYNDSSYRKRHRTLLQVIWKDPRTCTLAEYRKRPEIRDQCELIYTFIVGGSQNPEAPTERYEDRPEIGRPLVLDRMPNPTREDINVDDVTILNIRYVRTLPHGEVSPRRQGRYSTRNT
jgi:hypothetical protein